MTAVSYNQALYCPECDLIYSNDYSSCPICCNKNGISMNCIRNSIIKELGNLKERRGEIRPNNINQICLCFGE